MSKKNNRTTRHNAHQFALQREREAQQKKAEKAARKAARDAADEAAGALKVGLTMGNSSPSKFAVAVTGKKFKRKGIRLRKNSMVRGIRIKDASSRQKVKEILAAEEAMREMMVDEEKAVKVEKTKEVKMGGIVKKKKAEKKEKKAAKKASKPSSMES